MQPSARSLILDLLSTLRVGTMPVRALVEAGELLGIAENNVRVSLARLLAAGRVERDERGRYRLEPAVAAIRGQLSGWRRLDERRRDWTGDWIAVHSTRLGRGPRRRRRERALDLLGFRNLEPGLALRPDNLRDDLAGMRDRLHELGRDEGAAKEQEPSGLARVFGLHGLDDSSEAKARGLWDTEALAREIEEARSVLLESESRLPTLPTEAAMAESFLVGGRVLRRLVRDPLLPAEILDPTPFDDLVAGMRRYDELGRRCWAAFLSRFDVPHRALPLDARLGSGGDPSLGALPVALGGEDPLPSPESGAPA